jgi:hypothetical protein
VTRRSSHRSTVSNSSFGGFGFSNALAILFIGLKLGGVISWSWIWVLSPLWIPLALLLLILAIWAVAPTLRSFFRKTR